MEPGSPGVPGVRESGSPGVGSPGVPDPVHSRWGFQCLKGRKGERKKGERGERKVVWDHTIIYGHR